VKLELEEGTSLLMEPGTLELVTYSAAKKEILQQKAEVKPELHTSWKDGMLEFDHTPLTEALQILEDTYGVEVIYQDTTSTSRILDGGVPNDNLEVFIRTLKTIYGLDIEQKDQLLIIK
jgi:ferric-dicitrate binding protein FerR (iron transport regulator)